MASYNQLKLENQLCFKYYVISKEIIKNYKPYLEPLGLTYTAYITMLVLWEEDNISVKTLGMLLTLDSGTLTPLLKKLETKGFIKRIRSKSDERKVFVKLTSKGVSLKEEAKDIPYKISNDLFGNHDYSNEEIQEKLNALDEIFSIITTNKKD